MKILVTGGAGYIGSMLVPYLLHYTDNDILALDNFMYGQASLLDVCHHLRLEIIKGDVRDKETLKKALGDVDFVIHLAAIVGAPACEVDPITARTTIIGGAEQLLDLLDGRPIIYPCTNSGYGIGEEGIYCTEESPLRPVSLYGRLKVDAENKIMASGNAVSLRLATVFGASPWMRTELLVNWLVHRAIKDGFVALYQSRAKRNYIHIKDVCRAMVHCLVNWDTMKGNIYNVGLSDANLSKWELCEEIKKQVPNFYFIDAPVGSDPDKRDYIVSNEKLEATDWHPLYSLQAGIAELRKVYKFIG